MILSHIFIMFYGHATSLSISLRSGSSSLFCIFTERFKWSFPICFLKKQFKGLAEKLYTGQYPHHLNQARRNEAKSDRARLFPSQVKDINMCIAALYINTAASFKSNITNIYYCWPPIFSFPLFQKTICISDILRILVCDMAAIPDC